MEKKPVYKKWWFWVIIVVVVIAIASGGNDNENVSEVPVSSSEIVQEEITYENVDLREMFDELNNNAMKAESKYQDKNIQFSGKIASFDSDGSYISVEPVNADEWSFDSAMCYIKSNEQRDFLIEKNVGDVITIKGKVTSIGEILGYSINIAEVE